MRTIGRWVVAIGVTLAIGGCRSADLSTSDMGIDLAAPACGTSCPPCPSGTYCFPTKNVATACRPTCRTDDDCPAGMICIGVQAVVALADFDDTVPRFCAAKNESPCPGAAPACVINDGQHCTGFGAPSDTFAVPLTSYFGCAFEYQHCAHGCSRPDGGMFPGCNP